MLKEKKVVGCHSLLIEPSICVHCQTGKICKLSFEFKNKISQFPFEKILL